MDVNDLVVEMGDVRHGESRSTAGLLQCLKALGLLTECSPNEDAQPSLVFRGQDQKLVKLKLIVDRARNG
jgi:hypothetical protein